MDNIFLFIQCLSSIQHYAYMFDPNRQNLLHLRSVPTSYFSLLNQSFVKNYHISIITMFEKQSMINRLSNPINRNRSAAKISKVMSSSARTSFRPNFGQKYPVWWWCPQSDYCIIMCFWLCCNSFVLLESREHSRQFRLKIESSASCGKSRECSECVKWRFLLLVVQSCSFPIILVASSYLVG